MSDDTGLKNIKLELESYIAENYQADDSAAYSAYDNFAAGSATRRRANSTPEVMLCCALPQFDKIDFKHMYDEERGETFSEMLLRLIKESGEKNSDIYKRANIDRRHFSKIAGNTNYRTSKETALAFAIALQLDFDTTQEFLATAGYTLTKNNLADVIVTFFIEHKIYDIFVVNECLYEYKQPLLGG